MTVEVKFKNCDFDKHYVFNDFADSSIELELEFEKIITSQSKKALQRDLKQAISGELGKIKWLISGKVQVEVHWYLDSVERQITSKIGDLDNISKPLLDSLSGPSGILIDDCQINSIHMTWGSINHTKDYSICRILVTFNNDYTVEKGNLCFLEVRNAIYTPLNFDLNDRHALIRFFFIRQFLSLLPHLADFSKKCLNTNLGQYFIKSEYEFHRTRLNGFSKNHFLTLDLFKERLKINKEDWKEFIHEVEGKLKEKGLELPNSIIRFIKKMTDKVKE